MRRIRKGKPQFVSLVPKGANRLPVMLKDDGSFQFDLLTKTAADFMKNGEVHACVYAPELRDSQGDIASAEVIKDMAYEFAQEGGAIDIRHDGKPLVKSDVFVAESFIIQKGDDRFADMKTYDGRQVDVTGGWGVVLKVNSEDLRKKYGEQGWNGVSMGGNALFEIEKSAADRVVEQLAKRLGAQTDTGDLDMTSAELEATLKKSNESLVTSFSTALKEALKPAEPAPKPAVLDAKPDTSGKPVFKGDPMKIEDVKKHQESLAAFELRKDVIWDDAASVATYQTKLAELNKSAPAPVEKSDREKELEAELASIRKSSNQGGSPAPGNDPQPQTDTSGFSKEDTDLFKLGSTMGKSVNDQRGYGAAKTG